jgi:hypothetical protein
MVEEFRPIEPRFRALFEDLSIEGPEYTTAVERANRYAATLRNDTDFGVVDTVIGGSMGKRTGISPFSDVDMYVYLDEKAWASSRNERLAPSTIIGRLKRRIETRLSFERREGHVVIRPQGHSVGIRFRKERSIGIDVVPALVIDRNVALAHIPRRGTTKYIETSVQRQLALIDELDTSFHFLRRGIRLLKYWNRQTELGLHSYTVEVLGMHSVHRGCKRTESAVFLSTLDFIGSTDLTQPVFIPRYFSYAPPARRSCIIYDPAMPNNNLGRDLTAANGRRFGTAARKTLARLRDAVRHTNDGKERLAVLAFNKAFGRDE